MKRNNDELIDVICAAIEQSGADIDGYKAAGISRKTFYVWMREIPSFRRRVEAARQYYRDHSLPEMRKMCIRGLSRTLKAVGEGLEIVTSQTTDAINPRTGEVVTLETVTRKPAMVPISQAFQFVMGKDMDLISWLSQGVSMGLLPVELVESLVSDIDAVHARIRDRVSGHVMPATNAEPFAQRYDPSVAIAAALGLTDCAPVPTDDEPVSSGGAWGGSQV